MEKLIDDEKITRLEIINHAKNNEPVGRLLVLYKKFGDFANVESELQDGKNS